MNPDQAMPSGPTMSKEELLREKFKYIRKLEALEKKGVELSKKYTMESPLSEMQGEYETIMEEKSRQNSVKFQGNMMMAVINGIEFLNNRFDPFDIKLDGWGEQINENITDYDEIFGELYEKYKSRASMAPELKLLFQLGGSAMMVHMTNTLFKSAMPGMDDILRQNPDLMRQFQTAAVNTMGQNNPGFGGFMSGIMNPEPMVPPGRGPPPPMATQGFSPPSRSRGGNNSSAVDINLNMTRPNFSDDGINIRERERPEKSRRPVTMPEKRAEMKGPSDISDILSGLKTKTINIQEPQISSNNINANSSSMNESSTISITDLKELQENGNLPKRSKRRPKSDKNTISLDI
jgi:DNA-binding protein